MNELIQELAEEAGAKFPFGGFVDYREFDHEKFAMLIAQEYTSVLNKMHMWQTVNNQNYPGAWHDGVDAAIKTIQDHFGIEK
jgi:hypothetical protein